MKKQYRKATRRILRWLVMPLGWLSLVIAYPFMFAWLSVMDLEDKLNSDYDPD